MSGFGHLVSLLPFLCVTGSLWAQASPSNWRHQFGGRYKALFTASKTIINKTAYGDLMNRARLTYDGRYQRWLQIHVDYDNEAHFGNLITEPEFDLVRHRQEPAWFDLLHAFVDQKHAYWDTSLYRGYLSLRTSSATLTLGRQRIGWGTARFWSPADVFNPLNPLQIEAQERQGVDSAYLEWDVGGNLTLSTAYLPQAGFNRSTLATRLSTNLSGYDVAAFAGWFERDWSAGAEFAGQWGGAGLRGEMTYRWRDPSRREENALRFTFGSDYAFANTLYLVGEYFYNQGQPALSPEFDPASLFIFTSEIFTLHRHFLSGGTGYDVTPLFRVEAYAIADLAGGSFLFMPQTRYNLTPNTDLTVGAQFFTGDKLSEFGMLSHTFFTELVVHF